jgi:hypothetical protein
MSIQSQDTFQNPVCYNERAANAPVSFAALELPPLITSHSHSLADVGLWQNMRNMLNSKTVSLKCEHRQMRKITRIPRGPTANYHPPFSCEQKSGRAQPESPVIIITHARGAVII